MNGPPPKPTALKILEGNPGRRPLNMREPKPARKAPPMPPWLNDVAKKQWRKMVPILLRMGVLTEADGASLACWCSAYSILMDAHEKLRTAGILYVHNGYIQASPLLQIIKTQTDVMNRIGAEFGLSPASRVRIEVDGPAPKKAPGNKWAAV
jgi:P27 family predicted phage terminase small subunit